MRILTALSLTIAMTLVSTAPAAADHIGPSRGVTPNYTFPDGMRGFALTTGGGPVNPGFLVGFNPQPDPPVFPVTRLFVGDGSVRTNVPVADGNNYVFVIALTGLGSGALMFPPDPIRGVTSTAFDASADGVEHHYVVGLDISGPGDVATWSSFNPQPDPPGFSFGAQFSFAGVGDPDVTVTVSQDGVPLSFAVAGVPEPAEWAMLIAGFVAVGMAARRSRREMLSIA